MTIGSLFAGIGGFELAATWAGIQPLWSNEIDPFACKVLTKNFNHEIIQKDIREIGKHNLQPVDIISGGFPCQPFSQAGKRQGTDDDRYLWPEMCRIIKELRPTWVIGENVAGIVSMENGETLKRILLDLEDEGYHNEVFIIPSASVGAWHRRDRIWIVSNTRCQSERGKEKPERSSSDTTGCGGREYSRGTEDSQDAPNTDSSRYIHRQPKEQPTEGGSESFYKPSSSSTHEDVSDTDSKRGCRRTTDRKDAANVREPSRDTVTGRGNTKPSMGGVADGIPTRMDGCWEQEPDIPRVATGVKDRVHRLKGLGNAIVPQVAYELLKAIKTAIGLHPYLHI